MAEASSEPDRDHPAQLSEGQRLVNRFQALLDKAISVATDVERLRGDIAGKALPKQEEPAVRLTRRGSTSLFDGLAALAGDLEEQMKLIEVNVADVRKLF